MIAAAAATHAIAWRASTTTAKSVHWGTPDSLYIPLEREFGFTLDAAASPEMAKHVRYFTLEQDALAHSWAGERVFCNPPYGRQVARWMRKARDEAADHGALVVMLVPARTDTAWFHDIVFPFAEIRFLRGRLGYKRNGQVGRRDRRAPFASMLAIFRPGCTRQARIAEQQFTFPFSGTIRPSTLS